MGFGCQVIAYDPYPDQSSADLGIDYVSLDRLLSRSKIIPLHCPPTSENTHLIKARTLAKTLPDVTAINTGRGGLVNTADAIGYLKTVANLGLDVYGQEGKLFFRDLSGAIIDNDTIQRLMGFPGKGLFFCDKLKLEF